MKEKIEAAYKRFVRSLGNGIRSGDGSVSKSIEELERVVEELVAGLEEPGPDGPGSRPWG